MNNWRTMRLGLAPNEQRTAISRRRSLVLASSRLARLGAGDQEHDTGGREQQQQRLLYLADEVRRERAHDRSTAITLSCGRTRTPLALGPKVAVDRIDFASHRLCRRSRREPADGVVAPTVE